MNKQLHEEYRFFDQVTVVRGFFKCHEFVSDVERLSISLQLNDFKIASDYLNDKKFFLFKRSLIPTLTDLRHMR